MMQKLFLSEKAKCDLLWWIRSIPTSFNLISRDSPEFTLYTDSSLIGWGAHLNDQTCGDNWRASEKENHINYLELLAIYFACKAFKHMLINKHIKAMTDNQTAVSCVNHMGTSHSYDLNSLSRTLWEWCIKNNIFLTAAHIPGSKN